MCVRERVHDREALTEKKCHIRLPSNMSLHIRFAHVQVEISKRLCIQPMGRSISIDV